jgi:hypothetical protein
MHLASTMRPAAPLPSRWPAASPTAANRRASAAALRRRPLRGGARRCVAQQRADPTGGAPALGPPDLVLAPPAGGAEIFVFGGEHPAPPPYFLPF